MSTSFYVFFAVMCLNSRFCIPTWIYMVAADMLTVDCSLYLRYKYLWRQ